MRPLISICIPAYKRIDFVRRLLDSIAQQTFENFEVIVTDDSNDNRVGELCAEYENKFLLFYHHNGQQLGTPENWNEAIRKANGEWIKLMHDDDWFAYPDSLQKMVNLTKQNESCSFVFCGSTIIEHDKIFNTENISIRREKLLRKDPQNLFFRNFIGPPSVIMHVNDREIWYDNRMKWLVDVDFYIRFLKHAENFNFTREFLVNVGFNEDQVTKQVFGDKKIVLPENLLLLSKLDKKILLRIWNYDFAWRLLRNYGVRSDADLHSLVPPFENVGIPFAFLFILTYQKLIPKFLLRQGFISKSAMFASYLLFRLVSLFK